jgi:glycosyltransferase involved in cell wall biosynthesis
MKICFAVHHFLPNFTGGSEWETLRMATGLQAQGHEVNIITIERIDQGDPKKDITWVDDVYQGISVRRLFYNQQNAPDAFRWEYDNLWVGEAIRTWLEEKRPDIFHLISGYLISGRALKVAQEMGLKRVVSLMDYWFLCPRISMLRSDGKMAMHLIQPATCARCLGEQSRRYSVPAWIAPGLMAAYWKRQDQKIRQMEDRTSFLRSTLDQADIILSASQYLRSVYIKNGVSPAKILQIRQGLDFKPAGEKKKSDTLRVGYIGQLTHVKGVHILMEAVRALSNVPLHVEIYGEASTYPPYLGKLKKITGNDPRVHFEKAYHSEEEGAKALQNLDVLVVPSVWYENSPNVILEAFASGTPVIASNLGGTAELVQDGVSGLVFEAGNAADLAKKIMSLVQQPDLLQKLQKGIPVVKNVAQQVDELLNIYQMVLDSPILSEQLTNSA